MKINNMKQINIVVIIIISAVFLAACGANTPTSSNATPATTAPTTITMTVMFPPRNGPGGYLAPNPLISASTDMINISVYQSGTFNAYGNATIFAPASGGVASISVTLSKYAITSQVDIIIAGYNNATAMYNGSVKKTGLTVVPGTNTNISMAYVEVKQGVASISAVNLITPNGSIYTLDSLFLDYNPSLMYYQMGIGATLTAASSSGYHYSSSNLNPANQPAVNDVINGLITLSVDVPDPASTSIWNQYNINLDFAPGGIPTNTPTITGTFIGTFTNVSGSVTPASGTAGTGFLINNASWANNVAPGASATILF